MTTTTPPTEADARVTKIPVPQDARALSMLAHVDYEDAFVVRAASTEDRTAEQWIRALLEGAPGHVQRGLQSGWTAIGLKLGGTPSERLVAGWQIRHNEPEYVLLGAASRIGMPAELLLVRQRETLLFCTFVQQDNQMARTVWAGTEPLHVPIVRRLLERATRL
jgi:hypothetical protein